MRDGRRGEVVPNKMRLAAEVTRPGDVTAAPPPGNGGGWVAGAVRGVRRVEASKGRGEGRRGLLTGAPIVLSYT